MNVVKHALFIFSELKNIKIGLNRFSLVHQFNNGSFEMLAAESSRKILIVGTNNFIQYESGIQNPDSYV